MKIEPQIREFIIKRIAYLIELDFGCTMSNHMECEIRTLLKYADNLQYRSALKWDEKGT